MIPPNAIKDTCHGLMPRFRVRSSGEFTLTCCSVINFSSHTNDFSFSNIYKIKNIIIISDVFNNSKYCAREIICLKIWLNAYFCAFLQKKLFNKTEKIIISDI